MRNLLIVLLIGSLFSVLPARADQANPFTYKFQISAENENLDGVTLGDDPSEDEIDAKDREIEFDLEYQITADFYAFFVGSLIDETETVESVGRRESVDGLERKEIGVGLFFGEEIESELNIGRVEITSPSEWWLWWDEELDSIRLESEYGNFETMLAFAREQARESTGVDFIDPEQKGVERSFASLSWEFAPDQILGFYYLDQADQSESHRIGDFENFERSDEEDADLSWSGISYLGNFELDSIGEIEVEAHLARVSGDETLYEFDDPVGNLAEVTEIVRNSVSGSAQAYLLRWTPALAEDWTFSIGMASGSGDSNPGDNRDKSFRQTGLQGDSESYGELYQPELSNLNVQTIGISWHVYNGITLALMRFDYEQEKASDEIRDVSIELDPDGINRDLGSEIDLVVTVEAYDGLELSVVAAEFDAGKAYGIYQGETSRYLSIEIAYEF